MTFNLYNRKYELIIGPSGQPGRVYDDLQIRFKIEKTGDSAANKAEIEIYNLNADSRNFVSKDELTVILKAGYQNHFGQIFAGTTKFTHTTKGQSENDKTVRRGFEQKKKEDADWISKISAFDSLKALKHFIIISLANENLTELGVLNKVVDKLNESVKVARGTFRGVRGVRINHGKVITSTFKDVLDLLCRNQGLQWNINSGILNIYPKGGTVSDEIIKLDPGSGLIGSPEPTEKGYKFTSLLRHDLDIGTLVYVESKLIKEKFSIANVTHTGDLSGSEWYSSCEAIPV